jgi:hypothetical protein
LFASFPACLALAVALAASRRTPLPGLPALLMLLAALTLSAWVGIEGAVFEPTAPAVCFARNFEPFCWYVPEFSPLWRPFVEFRRPAVNQIVVGVYFCVVYAWLAAPLAADIFKRGRAAASTFLRTHAGLESWRV